jgi:hypothetical protein
MLILLDSILVHPASERLTSREASVEIEKGLGIKGERWVSLSDVLDGRSSASFSKRSSGGERHLVPPFAEFFLPSSQRLLIPGSSCLILVASIGASNITKST